MIKKRLFLPVSMMCLLACLTVAPASAQGESAWTASLDTTFASQYLWRGFVLNDSPSMQPSVTAGYGGFSVNWWSNNSYRVPNGQAMTESDFTFDYSHSFDKVGVSLGYILYTFPDIAAGNGNRTHEIYVGTSLDTLLSPSFTYYRDVDQGDGDYFYASVGHSVPLSSSGAALNLGTGVGLNHKQWIDITTVSNWDINVSVDIPWGKVTFSPFFTQMIGHETLFGKHNMFGVNMSVFSF